jgi:hypothetical protein
MTTGSCAGRWPGLSSAADWSDLGHAAQVVVKHNLKLNDEVDKHLVVGKPSIALPKQSPEVAGI